jgi:hypothetical protein
MAELKIAPPLELMKKGFRYKVYENQPGEPQFLNIEHNGLSIEVLTDYTVGQWAEIRTREFQAFEYEVFDLTQPNQLALFVEWVKLETGIDIGVYDEGHSES